MVIAVALSTVLFLGTLAGHHATMVRAGSLLQRGPLGFMAACGCIGLLHIAEVGAYAGAFGLGQRLGIGGFAGTEPLSAMDIFDFSVVNFPTLGLGSTVPTRHLRFLAGMEAFNGFLCISMSASLLFQHTAARLNRAS